MTPNTVRYLLQVFRKRRITSVSIRMYSNNFFLTIINAMYTVYRFFREHNDLNIKWTDFAVLFTMIR